MEFWKFQDILIFDSAFRMYRSHFDSDYQNNSISILEALLCHSVIRFDCTLYRLRFCSEKNPEFTILYLEM